MIHVMKGDITGLDFDLIVNPANSTLLPGSGINRRIFEKAGHGLISEVLSLERQQPGQVVLTGSYHLRCQGVLQAVVPVCTFHSRQEEEQLASCYWNCVAQAYDYLVEHQLPSLQLAFPSLSAGPFGLPAREACHIAVSTVERVMQMYPDARVIEVTFLVDNQEDYQLYKQELARSKA